MTNILRFTGIAGFCAVLFWSMATDFSAAQDQKIGQTTVIAVRNARFTVNGDPTFLLGFSYYAGLGASEDFVRQDLGDLQSLGFNWLRVWATWGAFDNDVSAVNAKGEAREPYLSKLKWLVAECDRRGIIVDVTLTRGKRSDKSLAGGNLPDFAAHQRAVETIIGALKGQRNWYLDLANERDVRDARYVSKDELKTLRELVRDLDPQLLVTASFGGHDLSEDDVRDSLLDVGCDFLSVHRPRNPESPSQTESRTRELLDFTADLKHPAPVHHQEPFRRGYENWEPKADAFLVDLRGAITGGAAGWCFHNGSQRGNADGQPRRSFDLRERRLMDQLDEEEQKFVNGVHAVLKAE
jgi:hypothetical protein